MALPHAPSGHHGTFPRGILTPTVYVTCMHICPCGSAHVTTPRLHTRRTLPNISHRSARVHRSRTTRSASTATSTSYFPTYPTNILPADRHPGDTDSTVGAAMSAPPSSRLARHLHNTSLWPTPIAPASPRPTSPYTCTTHTQPLASKRRPVTASRQRRRHESPSPHSPTTPQHHSPAQHSPIEPPRRPATIEPSTVPAGTAGDTQGRRHVAVSS